MERPRETMRLHVCIPSFEYPIGIERALQSLTLQTFRDFSVTVSDDSASNAVRDVVRGFEQRLPITYVRNTPPRGVPDNWNAWVGTGDSEYVQLLHHDDWLTQPDSLAKLVEALDNAPEAAFAFCNSVGSRADGSLIQISRPWPGWEERLAAWEIAPSSSEILSAHPARWSSAVKPRRGSIHSSSGSLTWTSMHRC